MKRKNELYKDFREVSKELKSLSSIVQNERIIPSEDEIHGWAIKMNFCMNDLNKLQNEVLEFYRN